MTASPSPTPPTPVFDDAARRALFLDARSTISFSSRPVDPAVIAEVYDLAKWGPTSQNTQPLRLAVAASAEARAAVIAAAMPGNRPKLDRAPLLVVVARDDRFHEHHSVLAPGFADLFDRFEANPEARSAVAHSGTWLQLGYVIMALRGEGLTLRPYGGVDRAALDAGLLPEHWHAEAVLAVGYPATEHGAGDRKGRLGAGEAVLTL